jgi:hypothetical protein
MKIQGILKYKIANLTLVGSLVILACAQGIIESVSAQANACPSTYITVQNAIDVPGEYSVWLEQNKPSNDSSLAYISEMKAIPALSLIVRIILIHGAGLG